MASKMTCRVCGKEYIGCTTMLADKRFSWQKVACSPECGQEYVRRILISRGELQEEAAPSKRGVIDQEATVNTPARGTKKKTAAKPESD